MGTPGAWFRPHITLFLHRFNSFLKQSHASLQVLDILAKSLYTQSLGIRLLVEACTYRAVEAVKEAAANTNTTFDIGMVCVYPKFMKQSSNDAHV